MSARHPHCKARGERNGRAVLTEAQVREIRACSGATHRELGRDFHVHHRTIGRVLRRETWAHLDHAEET